MSWSVLSRLAHFEPLGTRGSIESDQPGGAKCGTHAKTNKTDPPRPRALRWLGPLLKLVPKLFVIDRHMYALDWRSFHHSCQQLFADPREDRVG